MLRRRERAVLFRADFAVRGAFRSAARREACERLIVGDAVTLERERDNAHDPNAVLVVREADCELGYVPREEARTMAPLLDAGADAEAKIHRLGFAPNLAPAQEVRRVPKKSSRGARACPLAEARQDLCTCEQPEPERIS